MKIMHVIDSLGIGGAERVLAALLPALQERGVEAIVAVRTATLDLAMEFEAAGVRVVQLPARHKWNLFGTALDLSRLADEYRIDIIHAHLYFPAQATALVKLLGLHSAATVVTFHNLAYAKGVNRDGVGLRLKRMLAALLCRRGFDRKIAVSNAVAVHYRAFLGLDSVDVVHNPVDITAIDSLQLGRSLTPDKALHIVAPGRLVREKGQPDLIEALALLRDQGLDFRASIAGDGPMRRELERKVDRAGLGHVIAITGTLAHRKLLEVVAAADIVVIPSHFEGFGLAAIEAMALSRPVVVTAVGGLVEIVEDGVSGAIVPAHQPGELARAVSELMASPVQREAFGRAGRKRVEQAFDLPRITTQLCDLYDDTLASIRAKTSPGAGRG
ncbi:MAG: glycosyltransferase family 4 protein [Halioglobus sp.]|nr:glycosyltransferase family 4 protein [Halioglobus sp.]